MTLNDWLHRLERLHYKAIDMGLERVSQVAQRLNLLSDLPFIFTVGGTNGKGSTVAFLESVLLAHGYHVGVYTSPHLIDFNERVRIDGVQCDDAALIAAFGQIEARRGDVSLTYFEFTTLAAMLVFKQRGLDVLVLEVGLGGRLDAVNIWDADIAMVTSIDLDHQQFLGDTREKIGLEKIGIGRAGRPLLMGEPDAPELVLNAARSLGCRLLQIGVDFAGEQGEAGRWQFRGLDAAGAAVSRQDLAPTHLYWRNAVVALQALLLSPFNLEAGLTASSLASATLTGRQQIVQQDPAVMLDVGHNPHAAAHLAKTLVRSGYRHVHCVVGMLGDKAVADTLVELLPAVDRWYPATLTGPRGLDGESIGATLLDAGALTAPAAESPRQAYRAALREAGKEDLILVFGSFYTVADVIQYRRSMSAKG